MSYIYGIKGFSLVDWVKQNGPGLCASTRRGFPDLTRPHWYQQQRRAK